MKCIDSSRVKRIALASVPLLAVALGAFLAWVFMPENADGIRRSAVIVEETAWNEVDVSGKPMLYFYSTRGDSALVRVTHRRDSAIHRHYAAGCWVNALPGIPSCKGRVATVTGNCGETRLRRGADIGRLCRDAVESELKTLKGQKAELDYYLRVHGVQDNGYQQIAALAQQVAKDYGESLRAKAILDSVGTRARFSVALRRHYTVLHRDSAGRLSRTACTLVARERSTRLALLQTADGKTPDGVKALMLLPWNCKGGGEIRVAGFGGLGVSGLECDTVGVSIVAGHATKYGRHDVPPLLASDGSVAFTRHGHFMGLTSGEDIIGRAAIRRLVKQGGRR